MNTRPRVMPEFRKILVIRWGGMGDLVIATAIIQDIANAFPEAAIDINTERPWDQLFLEDPRCNEILTCPVRGGNRIGKAHTWLGEIAKRNYDLIIDLQNNDHSRILLAMLRIFYKTPGIIAGIKKFFPYNVKPPAFTRSKHALLCMQGALVALGIPARTNLPVLHTAGKNRDNASVLLNEAGLETGRFIILVPGSSIQGKCKRWSEDRYIDLAARLHAHYQDKIVLVGSSVDNEACESIGSACGNWSVNLCNKTEILDLLPLARSARLVIGNDTGVMHVTATAGKPTIVLFGCTNPVHSKPLGEKVRIIQADEHLLESGMNPEPESIQKISVDRVYSEVLSATG